MAMGDNQRRVGNKVIFPFQTAIVAWVDLLGYGSQISAGGFNPLSKESKAAHRRLKVFHHVIAQHSHRIYPSLVLNDGAILYRDLSYRSNSVTYDFIRRSWGLFQEINKQEKSSGFPGARMVIATGFRVRGRRAGIDRTKGQLKSIFGRLEDGKISTNQAINEAARAQARFDIVPHLQSNYAFTKAYLAESDGSSAGMGGSSCFLDLTLVNTSAGSEIEFAEIIPWENSRLGLSANFGRIEMVKHNNKRHIQSHYYRTGLSVAEHLTDDPSILLKLRDARRKYRLS